MKIIYLQNAEVANKEECFTTDAVTLFQFVCEPPKKRIFTNSSCASHPQKAPFYHTLLHFDI